MSNTITAGSRVHLRGEHWEDEPRPDPVEYIVRQITAVS